MRLAVKFRFQLLGQLLVVLLMGVVERSIGLPLASAVVASLMTANSQSQSRYGFLLASSLLVSVIFNLDWWLIFGVMVVAYSWLRFGGRWMRSLIMRLILLELGWLVGWWLVYQPPGLGIGIYGVVVMALTLAVTKANRLQLLVSAQLKVNQLGPLNH